MNSSAFAEETVKIAENLGIPIKTTLVKGDDLLKRGFGGIYHVGKAAEHPPIFLCFSHNPSGATKDIALVGKGIMFDTGGMQIKTKTGMPSMKCDMGGAAAVFAAFCTLVQSGFKQNLHCLLCIAENSVSPKANRPDDIITMLSGKSVEIANTDAEGRLVLADGVFYAMSVLKASTIIDVATLTGAQAYVSGRIHAAVLCNKEETERLVVKSGRKSGDLVHPLPYAPDLHFSDLKSQVADMKNSNLGSMEGPPSAIAGLFIASHIDFTEDVNWIHLDIAAPAFKNDRATAFGPPLICSVLSEHLDVPLLN
uniref:CYTOSOL_AP domain-containing protein n=2 Tax=Bursaphelenchus xylophilus TaxID=6326 RepID=A0A1I7SM94_BURXY